ncbi:tRNA threonylcarbamoyladenosine biosynthesis protein TsaB [Andreprevotia lacus DSM 23236]|jgi:tRNA threonylcarbamoyladenosine biosynthesis protein TsaB|uniref:tRNA threonylcarbamoyladenosine biosynthesis protein TsaB n=1 Tax=Andreprevotia lacus DSM 23236 TaxID=1121001 RepID=A0A1W1XD30_9NEIS|nr:tRNA (adenosine(37)-N6)-threonylcarbamoyltransferase complex dimerization subunit type 1 TsaB [Andreprevotia lacus]SMC21797.1 tRNA threonylcarbamoyladenosine biosynthesis protein TsaB [Andreprevotia lacus DSM 23236]
MTFIALDTSTEQLSLALSTPDGVVARDWQAGQRHAEHTLPYLEAFLAEHGVARSQIKGVAYGMGPGSFTGLRIACGLAQGLAFGLGVPVVGVSTLEALAAQAPAGQDRVYACLDARMNQVYCAAYRRSGDGWQEVTPPTLADPDAVPQPEGNGWLGLGSGFAAYADALQGRLGAHLSATHGEALPRAAEMLALALPRFAAGLGVPPHDAPLVYLRDKVALKTHERVKK